MSDRSEGARRLSLFCGVMMMVLYGGALLHYDIKEDARELPVYAWVLVCSLLAGCSLISGLKSFRTGRRRRGIAKAGLAIALMTAGRSWNLGGLDLSQTLGWLVLYFKYVITPFWFMWALLAVKISGCVLGKDKPSDVFGGSLLYVLFTIFGIWLLEVVMNTQKWEGADWMFPEVLILGSLSCLVFFKEYIGTLKRTGLKALAAGIVVTGIAAAGIAAAGIAAVGIVAAVGAASAGTAVSGLPVVWTPSDKSTGIFQNVNWLDHRLEVFKANWSGALNPGWNQLICNLPDQNLPDLNLSGQTLSGQNLLEEEIWLTWKRYALSCLNAEYGKGMVLVFLILFAGLLFFAGRISYDSKQMERISLYIRAELIMIFICSTWNELFLIQTGVGMGNYFPLSGYGVQLLPLLFILYSPGNGRRKQDAVKSQLT